MVAQTLWATPLEAPKPEANKGPGGCASAFTEYKAGPHMYCRLAISGESDGLGQGVVSCNYKRLKPQLFQRFS